METTKPHTSKRATYQDVLDAPAHKVAELVDGVLYTFPRPAFPHSGAASKLLGWISPAFDGGRGGPGGWRIYIEPELHFGSDIVVPDLAGWRRERMPKKPTSAYSTLAPDWLCETLSPSTRRFDLGKKRDIYARESVRYMWLIDPDDRSLEAFELHGGHWTSLARLVGNQQVSLPPFEAISFSLGDLWTDSYPPRPRGRPQQIHDRADMGAGSV